MQGRKKGRLPEINVTPLVDVMLVLLVIFMAVAPAMHSDLSVKVPKIKYSIDKNAIKKEDLIKIVIACDGDSVKLFINEKAISEAEIIQELGKYAKNLFVFIKADKNLKYEQVYKMLDLIKAAGFDNVALVGLQE